jgi:hypothetical protein
VPADIQNLSAKYLEVQVIPAPMAIKTTELRQLFADLGPYHLDVFNPTPDGGAVLSSPALQRQLILTPSNRQVGLSVEVDARRSLEDIVAIFSVSQKRLPAPTYIASSLTLTAHLPITGETSADLLYRNVLSTKANEAMAALGGGVRGVGIRAFLSGDGPFTFTVEPLIADPTKIVITLQQVQPGPFQLTDLAARCNKTLAFYEHELHHYVSEVLLP